MRDGAARAWLDTMPLFRPAPPAALLALAVAATGLAADPPVASAQLPQAPKVSRYRAELKVSGWVSVTRTRDDRAECRPGQAWTMTNRATVDVKRTVTATVINGVLGPIAPPPSGDAAFRATLDSYTTTNFCPPSAEQPLHRPQCDGDREGRVQLTLGSDPGSRNRVALGLVRIGGGSEGEDCRASTYDLPGGHRFSTFDHDPSGLTFNLDLRGRSFQTLGRGKRLDRLMRFSGPCDAIRVSHGPKPRRATGDCVVEGNLRFIFRRR